MHTIIQKKDKGFTLLYAVIISAVVLTTVISLATTALKQRNIATVGENSQIAFYAANSGMECALYWTLHGRDIQNDINGTITDDTIDLFKIPRISNASRVFNGNYDSPLSNTDNTDQSPNRVSSDLDLSGISCFDRSIVEDSFVYGFDTRTRFPDDQWHEAKRGNDLTEIGNSLDNLCGKGFVEGKAPQNFRVWKFRTILPDLEGDLDRDNSCAEVSVCRYLNTASLSISSRGYNTCDLNAANVVERAVRLVQE